ncbi:MAG TPA: GNAT family N-acetyltransferase [Flavisolibacter sp.]|nr:GNAT family N-acetyltransferase [Flavisolibacter sp.]
MHQNFSIRRTTAIDPDFQLLVSQLDHELWDELKEDQATYDQYNKVSDVETAIVGYINDKPVACGCFKEYDAAIVEIKRMFVQKTFRGNGLSRRILKALEEWAMEKAYRFAVLETSIHFATARHLYETNNYHLIPNYPPYTGLEESVCMKKELKPSS